MASELIFRDLDGAPYQPVRHFNKATSRSAFRVKPAGASNRTEDCVELETVEELAKAMLVDGLPARVKALSGGSVNYLRFGVDKLISYELEQQIADRLGIPARGGPSHENRDTSALARLRARFLQNYPDFEQVGCFSASVGSYHDAFRSHVDALLGAVAQHPDDGEAVVNDLLLASRQQSRGARPPFFDGDVVWRTPQARSVDPQRFDAAVSQLLRGDDDPSFAIERFNAEFWPLLQVSADGKPRRDTRVVPSTLLAIVSPDHAISVRYQYYSNASKLLNDRFLFSDKPMTAKEYRDVLALAQQIRGALIAWGWKPRDLWDVHGFILATCADRDSSSINYDLKADSQDDTSMTTSLILYGPPGTGKTYQTAHEAVRLCGEEPPIKREELMARYNALADAGRIEFVTFHQSMAYEEFVEGLRPSSTDEDGQPLAGGFRLVPTPGIFRRIARRAETSTGPGDQAFAVGGRQVFKMSLGDATNPDDAYLFEEAIRDGHIVLGFDDIDWSDPKYEHRDEIMAACQAVAAPDTKLTAQSAVVQMPHIFRNWMRDGDVVIVSKGTKLFRAIGVITGGYRFAPREGGDYGHQRDVRWLWVDRDGVPVEEIYARGFSMRTTYAMFDRDLNIPALERYANSQQDGGSAAPESFVLVIDEINRANISKVFGELITLLEADKRLGRANALKVRLPYSGDMFGVPANLHIIGTMNTADRSIALIDKALRRRFTFREMMPDYSVLGMEQDVTGAGVSLAEVLEAINSRIEYLLDREHQIGHGWLLGCHTKYDLDAAMRDKLIPLIAEYFFEDWGRAADVLGGRDGNPFLEAVTLPPPMGMSGEEPRYRWLLRSEFAANAYLRLVGRD